APEPEITNHRYQVGSAQGMVAMGAPGFPENHGFPPGQPVNTDIQKGTYDKSEYQRQESQAGSPESTIFVAVRYPHDFGNGGDFLKSLGNAVFLQGDHAGRHGGPF